MVTRILNFPLLEENIVYPQLIRPHTGARIVNEKPSSRCGVKVAMKREK